MKNLRAGDNIRLVASKDTKGIVLTIGKIQEGEFEGEPFAVVQFHAFWQHYCYTLDGLWIPSFDDNDLENIDSSPFDIEVDNDRSKHYES